MMQAPRMPEQRAAAELLVLEPRLQLLQAADDRLAGLGPAGSGRSLASSCLSAAKRNSTAPSPALSRTLPTNPSQTTTRACPS